MKNKLHKIHHTKPSLRVAKRIEKSKFSNFQFLLFSILYSLFSILYSLFSILYSLFSISATAQQYQWQWAVNGGGSLGESGWYYQVEQVFDIQVGTDNNYYFVAKIKNGTPQLGGATRNSLWQPTGWQRYFYFLNHLRRAGTLESGNWGGGYLMLLIT